MQTKQHRIFSSWQAFETKKNQLFLVWKFLFFNSLCEEVVPQWLVGTYGIVKSWNCRVLPLRFCHRQNQLIYSLCWLCVSLDWTHRTLFYGNYIIVQLNFANFVQREKKMDRKNKTEEYVHWEIFIAHFEHLAFECSHNWTQHQT